MSFPGIAGKSGKLMCMVLASLSDICGHYCNLISCHFSLTVRWSRQFMVMDDYEIDIKIYAL